MILTLCLLSVQDAAYALQPCEQPKIEDYSMVFRVTPISSTVMQDEWQMMKQGILAKDEGWDEQTIEGWFGKPTISRLRILEVFKGEALQNIEIHHGSKSIFGLDFQNGREYLVHLNKSKEGPHSYQTNNCDVEAIDEAKPSAIYLRAQNYKEKSE